MSKLDEWLGRAPLQARIEELEADVERLQRRYEAESDRRAEAVRERQTAQERANRLEDRVAQLEGELERSDDDGPGLSVRRRERLRGDRLEAVLDRISSYRTGSEGAFTAWIPDRDSFPADLTDLLGERTTLVGSATPCLVWADDAGIVSVAIDPPVEPTLEPTWGNRFVLDRSWFRPTGRFAVALVRADLFAIGVYDGETRQSFAGFESEVKGSHSKGGFSQARFERIRDGQIDDHLEACSSQIESTLAEADTDRLVLVGQREAIDAVADSLAIQPVATDAVDATGKPAPALADAVRSFWTTDVRVL